MNNPKISVVMTVLNGARFIKEAIDSILNQTFNDFEFIIVDNASSDKTKELIYSYKDSRIKLIKNKENLGQTKALNIGIRSARGEFIARMDADDVSCRERLQLQFDYLNKNKEVAVVGSWHEEINEKGKHIKYFKMPVDPLEIKCYLISPGELGYYCVSHPTVMIRRKALFEVGLYNEDYHAQDYELWTRIVRKYSISNINQYLVKHRISSKQQTKEFRKNIESDCEKIIISNVRYYLPSISDAELMLLTRMLLYKPQIAKEDGLNSLVAFAKLFEKYTFGEKNTTMIKKIRNKIEIFYLLQLLKTNPVYSLSKLFKSIFKNPDIFPDQKFYGKIAKAIYS